MGKSVPTTPHFLPENGAKKPEISMTTKDAVSYMVYPFVLPYVLRNEITSMKNLNSRLEDGTGCDLCRARHLKCDDGIPSCAQCVAIGIECVRCSKFRFRYETSEVKSRSAVRLRQGYVFPHDQIWLSTAFTPVFVDGNEDVPTLSDSDVETLKVANAQPSPFLHDSNKDVKIPTKPSHQPLNSDSPLFPSRFTLIGPPLNQNEAKNGSAEISEKHSTHEYQQHTACDLKEPTLELEHEITMTKKPSIFFESAGCHSDSPLSLLRCPTATSNPALGVFSTRTEAILFRHFIEYLCPWILCRLIDHVPKFDLTDPQDSFRKGVCQNIISSSILREAVFAISSRHLSYCGKFDPTQAHEYQRRCVMSLIPCLNDLSACQNDALLAATVMLRVTEELEGPRIGIDSQAYIIGIHAFIGAFEKMIEPSAFRKASFWTGLRQEVGDCLRRHTSVRIPLDFCFADPSFRPADEGTWANRIILHLAAVINFCLGINPRSLERYRELKRYTSDWYNERPISLRPYYATNLVSTEDDVFPKLWYSNNAAITAAQYYNITCLLLASFSPEIPRVGSARLRVEQDIERELRDKVKEMCGVAISNPRSVPSLLVACDGIFLCGDRFSDPIEQRALCDILVKAETEVAWPTRSIQDSLRKIWQD